MSMDTLFAISSPIAMIGWIALIISRVIPKWSDRIATYISPGLLSLAYMSLILAFWSGAEGGFDTLANVQLLFTQEKFDQVIPYAERLSDHEPDNLNLKVKLGEARESKLYLSDQKMYFKR